MYEKITSHNVVMFAIKHYDNPQCEGEKEFEDDLKRFKYIKRLLRRYYETDVLKERLLLNHLIVLNNVFSVEAATTLLLYKIQPSYWPALKSFLMYLNSIQEDELKDIPGSKSIISEAVSPLKPFRKLAKPILDWSKKNKCRHFVRIIDGKTTKKEYKNSTFTIEHFFYKYEEK